jgi:hypothetical protein
VTRCTIFAAGVEYTPQMRRVLFNDVRTPKTPAAKMVQRVTVILAVIGALIIVFLPDVMPLHIIAFTAMFGIVFVGVPTLVLQSDGTLSRSKLALWCGIIVLFGAMTAIASGDNGTLWSWTPWAQQFSGGAPTHVGTPVP